jgi:hypothetical protein
VGRALQRPLPILPQTRPFSRYPDNGRPRRLSRLVLCSCNLAVPRGTGGVLGRVGGVEVDSDGLVGDDPGRQSCMSGWGRNLKHQSGGQVWRPGASEEWAVGGDGR